MGDGWAGFVGDFDSGIVADLPLKIEGRGHLNVLILLVFESS